jgi:hypothetical protein
MNIFSSVWENDLEVLVTYIKLAPSHIRIFYIRPDDELDSDFPTGLRFDKLRMQNWMNKGRRMTKQVIRDLPMAIFPLLLA